MEGAENWILDSLSRRPELICSLSYLFVEFHHLPGRRANLTRWGLPEALYEIVKDRVHAAMERPSCRLQVRHHLLGACWLADKGLADKGGT